MWRGRSKAHILERLAQRYPGLSPAQLEQAVAAGQLGIGAGLLFEGSRRADPLTALLLTDEPPSASPVIYFTLAFERPTRPTLYRTIRIEAEWSWTGDEVVQELTNQIALLQLRYPDLGGQITWGIGGPLL